jgi:uncharacterized membrane protein YccC
MPRMKLWSWQKENLPSIGHSVRTALAATASVVVARLVQMPEAYWAAIATLVVMQSSLGATLTLSIERIVATALGASVGALESNYFGANLVAFMLAIFFIGLLSFGFRLLSICQCHPDDHCFDSAHKSRVDRCSTSIH